MKISYNWLKWYIDGELPEAEKLADILTFKLCEVEGIEKLPDGDTVLDLNILPNRAHDLLSHQGVAKEVAGLLGFKYKDPAPLYKVPETVLPTELKIEIQTENCRRYMGRVVRNIKVGPSPEWVVKHLESIGQRSINNIVDATNIVMFDCGQPCHAFDLAKIDGGIQVREAGSEQDFPVLGRDQIVAKLKATDMVIADTSKALALAGVKGGMDSGVSEATTDIILEVANFNPVAVRKTARRLNLLSDSAKRFENDLSPTLGDFAMKELTGLIIEMCPEATFEDVVDVYPNPVQPHTISFSISKINKYLGTELSEEAMVQVLTDYGYEISGSGLPAEALAKVGDTRTLVVPPLRLDLTGTHDVAEEVARLYGLEKIQAVTVELPLNPKKNETFYKMNAVRAKLVADGYRETITYAFRKKGIFEVARGVGDKGALRVNLSDGLKEAYEMNRLNAPLLGISDMKVFEIGTVFPLLRQGSAGQAPEYEVVHVAYADKKGVTEMTLEEFCEKNVITAGDSYENILPINENTQHFVQWSQYPFISRDIAVWVPESVTSEELKSLYTKLGTGLLVREPDLFDQFTKDGKTSYAFRLVFQAADRTLTDVEINPIMESIQGAIEGHEGWQIR